MARKYSVKAKLGRWPLQVFFNILIIFEFYIKKQREKVFRSKNFYFNWEKKLDTEHQKEEQLEKEKEAKIITNITTCDRKNFQIRFSKVID